MQSLSSTLAVRNHSVGQTEGKSLLSANGSSGQDQIQGSGQTDEMRKTHAAAVEEGNSYKMKSERCLNEEKVTIERMQLCDVGRDEHLTFRDKNQFKLF